MTGWLTPKQGDVLYQGRSLSSWGRRHFARDVGVVPQSEDTSLPFTVKEVVLMGRYAHQGSLIGFDDPEDQQIAMNVLEKVGLEDFADRLMTQLSGGERQRVLIARALAQCPSVLLLDEPTASLDLSHQHDVFGLLEKLNDEHALTIMVVTHDINLAAMFCKRVVVMNKGVIAADGSPEKIIQKPLLSEIYRVPLEVSRSEQGALLVSLLK